MMRIRPFLALLATAVSLVLSACSTLAPTATPAADTLATLSIGKGPILLAMAPDGSRVFAATGDRVAVIDAESQQVVASFPGKPNPAGLAVSADGQRLYVTHLFSDTMAVLDLATGAVVDHVDLVSGRRPGGWGRIAVSSDRQLALSTNRERSWLGLVDLVGRTTRTASPDLLPRDVAISADGRSAYICGCPKICSAGEIQIFDVGSKRFGGEITVGNNPYRIVLSPDGRSAFTANLGEASISVVDLFSRRTVATIATVPNPTGLALSADGNWLFATSNASGEVAAIDVRSQREAGRLRVGRKAREVVVSPNGRQAWVSTTDAVVVLDTAVLTGRPD